MGDNDLDLLHAGDYRRDDHPASPGLSRPAAAPKRWEIIVAGVSYRRQCVRGEGKWQPPGLPASRGA
jgi:hypothetical protein